MMVDKLASRLTAYTLPIQDVTGAQLQRKLAVLVVYIYYTVKQRPWFYYAVKLFYWTGWESQVWPKWVL